MHRKAWAPLLSAAVFVAVVSAIALTRTETVAAQNDRWGAGYFPNVTLTTQDGAKVRFYDDLIKGKVVAIELIYTSCKYSCPLETARLAQVQTLLGDRVGRDIFFYSITIDPEHDTPAVLKDYAQKYHAGPGWLFLTGRQLDIDLISKKLGIYSEPGTSKDGHDAYLLVGNEATGQWMRNAATDNPRFLARTIADWMTNWQSGSTSVKPATAPLAPGRFGPGQYVFATHCAPCHSVGGGDKIGPDLLGVTAVRDHEWLMRFITTPDKVLDSKDAVARALLVKYKGVRMPSLALNPVDVGEVIRYLEEQAGDARAAAASQTAAVRPAGAVDVKPLIDPYLRVQQALAADALDAARAAAGAVAAAGAKLGADGQAIQSAAGDLQRATDLKSARAAFGQLSDALMMLAKESGVRLDDDVKVAYCPMVRTYWLQKGEEIRNPFYGREMADCGRLNPDLPILKK